MAVSGPDEGLLARLNSVGWGGARLGGPGVRQAVLDLWAPGPAEEALNVLMSLCIHRGRVRRAAVELLPFLVAAVADPAVTIRHRLIVAVEQIVTVASGRGRPVLASRPGWAEVWAEAVRDLLPLLDDASPELRRPTAALLGHVTHRPDKMISVLRDRFAKETDLGVADQIRGSVEELAWHVGEDRRAEVQAWLHRAWAAEAGTRPEAFRATVGMLARLAWPPVNGNDDLFTLRLSESFVVRDLLKDDDPAIGLELARVLLEDDRAGHRTGGLQLAARLMASWRSAVPALLPSVAALIDDALADNRALALRILSMCGQASRPWADAAAARLTHDGEPDWLVRTQALWMLGKLADDRCVPVLAERMNDIRREPRHGFRDHRLPHNLGRWYDLELNFCEILKPFAAHHEILLPSILVKLIARQDGLHYPAVLARWHRQGAPVVPRMLELLGTRDALPIARALAVIDPGPVAAHKRSTLRRFVPSPDASPDAPSYLGALAYWRITGDPEPAFAVLRSPGAWGSWKNTIWQEMGPAAAEVADLCRPKAGPEYERRKRLTDHARSLWRVTGRIDEAASTALALSSDYLTPRPLHYEHAHPLMLLSELAEADPALRPAALERLLGAATHLPPVHRSNGPNGMDLAWALWRLGGPAEDTVRMVLPWIDRLTMPGGWSQRNPLEPLTLLTAIAAANPAALEPAVPRLRELTHTDRRPLLSRHWQPGHPPAYRNWRSVEDDDSLRAAVHAVFEAIAKGGPSRTGR
ncbi:hypothetical protein ABGB12_22675 [Actinocorallia sp. B10E7]|uniref:hypothetical protein n=1 Tax=Actinocorallia sp. B10E7 TaxID=3153558 RepID=UPI00325C45C0